MPHARVGKSGKSHVQGRLGASGPVPRRSLARDDASPQLNQNYAQTCLACQSSSATLTNSLSDTNPALCYTRRLQRLFLPDIGVAAHLPWPALVTRRRCSVDAQSKPRALEGNLGPATCACPMTKAHLIANRDTKGPCLIVHNNQCSYSNLTSSQRYKYFTLPQ